MCGIFSFILNRPLNNKDILIGQEGRKLLKHRGPDSHGEWYNKKKGIYGIVLIIGFISFSIKNIKSLLLIIVDFYYSNLTIIP